MKLNKHFKYAIIHSRNINIGLIELQKQLMGEWKITLQTIYYLQTIEFDYKNLQKRLREIKKIIKGIIKGGENAKNGEKGRAIQKNRSQNKKNKYKPND